MRAEDKNIAEVAKKPVQLYHHGPLGRVLQRFLQERGERQDFDRVALEQLWQRAAAHDPAIGLHLFSLFSRQDWHVLACLGFYARNAAESIASWVRYQRLASSLDAITQIETEELLGVAIRVHASVGLERYLVEHYMSMAVTQMRAAAEQPLQPARVCLRHAQPDYWQAYQPLLGEQLVFGAARNELWFKRTDLLRPNPGANDGMYELATSELDRRLAQQRRFGGAAGQVAEQLRQGLLAGHVPSLEEIAAQLHLSPRTLRRRLQDQQLNFRQLLDLVRAELDQYLALQGLTRAQVAEHLGYGDTAAYLHARKRWATDSGSTQAK